MLDKQWYEKSPEERNDAESAEAIRNALKMCEFFHKMMSELPGSDEGLRAKLAANIKEGQNILSEFEAKSHAA